MMQPTLLFPYGKLFALFVFRLFSTHMSGERGHLRHLSSASGSLMAMDPQVFIYQGQVTLNQAGSNDGLHVRASVVFEAPH